MGVAKLVAFFYLYQALFLMLGFVAGYLYYYFTVGPIDYEAYTLLPQATTCRATGLAAGMTLSSLVMIAHLFVFKYVRPARELFGCVRGGVLLLSTLFIGCLMVVFNIIAAWLGLENNSEAEVKMMLSSPMGILTVAVLAPLLEELLFRGVAQRVLARYFKSPWVGIIVAALLFGVVHGNPVQIFYATCLGVGFGWLYHRTGSLLPAIVGHMVNNSLAVLVSKLFGSGSDAEVPVGSSGELAMVILFLLLAFVFARAINKRCSSL